MKLRKILALLVAMVMTLGCVGITAMAAETPEKGYMLYTYDANGAELDSINGLKSASAFNLITALSDFYALVPFPLSTPSSIVIEVYEDSTSTDVAEIKYNTTINTNGHTISNTYNVADGVTLTIDGNVYKETAAVAKIGDTTYATLAEALAAANSMSGEVTVEIYDKVTLDKPITGSFSTINFVGKTDSAEIYMDVQGYIEAPGKNVSFKNLILSKVAGGFVGNAGFMNLAFGIYEANEVSYTNCTFANGAYAAKGKNTFTGCTFYRSHDRYGFWAYGSEDIVIDECTFADFRGIKIYDEGFERKTAVTVKNTDFSAVSDKPAIVLTSGKSVTLVNNTYSSTGVFELDLDGNPDGTPITSDVAPTCINDNGACGVLVDGKIYTTVTKANEVATEGSNVILLFNSDETVKFAEGVILDKNSFEAPGVTVASSPKVAYIDEQGYETVQAAIDAAQNGETVVICAGEYGAINISNKNITIRGTVGENGELLTTIKGGNPAITGHSFNGTIKDIKIVDAWKVMYAEPAGNITIDNVYVKGATYGFHLVAYSPDLTWKIENSYMDLSWANSLGVYGDGDADIIIKGNEFVSTSPYYPDYGALHVNSFLPNVTIEENIFRENAKIYIDASVTDTSNVKISKNYHADGYENAFADDADGVTVKIDSYYTAVDENGNLTGLVEVVDSVAKIGDTEYTTLEEALKAATNGCTIEILADITIDYYWDCRNTGAKITVPVTIDGNGKTIKFTNTVYDAGNQMAAFRFEADATVKDITIDMSEAISGFAGRFRAISTKADLTVDGCEFIGNGSENNTRAIIYGEGAGETINEVDVVITNSKFVGWRRGVSDNENAQDAKTVVVTGNTFTDADVAVSATDVITLTDNIVNGKYVSIKSYTDSANLVVTATGNTLTANVDENNMNYIDVASKNVTAQKEFYIPVVLPNAEVSVLEPLTLDAGSYMIWPSGSTAIERPLEIVMNFKANDSLEDCLSGGFDKWLVDFNLKFTGLENGSITADNCYLAGNYGAFGWVVIPADGMVLEEGISYPVVAAYDATLNYKDICKDVKNFTAAIHVDQAILDANPNFKVELSLVMTNPDDANDKLVIGEPAVYTAADLKNEETEEVLETNTSYIRGIETKNAAGDDRYQVILFSGIDSLEYASVGFEVTVENRTVAESTNTVYTSYVAAGSRYPASAWGEKCEYIFALPINFPTSFADKQLTFRPFAVKLDGVTKIWGIEKTIDKIYNK